MATTVTDPKRAWSSVRTVRSASGRQSIGADALEAVFAAAVFAIVFGHGSSASALAAVRSRGAGHSVLAAPVVAKSGLACCAGSGGRVMIVGATGRTESVGATGSDVSNFFPN